MTKRMEPLDAPVGPGRPPGATASSDGATGGHGRPAREFLSLAEAGSLLGVGRCRAWELARAGLLPAIRLGRRWYVPRRALDALAERALAESAAAAARGGGEA